MPRREPATLHIHGFHDPFRQRHNFYFVVARGANCGKEHYLGAITHPAAERAVKALLAKPSARDRLLRRGELDVGHAFFDRERFEPSTWVSGVYDPIDFYRKTLEGQGVASVLERHALLKLADFEGDPAGGKTFIASTLKPSGSRLHQLVRRGLRPGKPYLVREWVKRIDEDLKGGAEKARKQGTANQ